MSEKLPAPSGEFLLYQTEDGRIRVECRFSEESIWLSQKLMAELFDVAVPTINEHLKALYESDEIDPGATIRKFRIVRQEGGREVARVISAIQVCPAVILLLGEGREQTREVVDADGKRVEKVVKKGMDPTAAEEVMKAPIGCRDVAPLISDGVSVQCRLICRHAGPKIRQPPGLPNRPGGGIFTSAHSSRHEICSVRARPLARHRPARPSSGLGKRGGVPDQQGSPARHCDAVSRPRRRAGQAATGVAVVPVAQWPVEIPLRRSPECAAGGVFQTGL